MRVALLALIPALPVAAQSGIITKPSRHAIGVTLDRLEAALKERGFIIFTRIDHAAAAAAVGLKMPSSTLLVFGDCGVRSRRSATPSRRSKPHWA